MGTFEASTATSTEAGTGIGTQTAEQALATLSDMTQQLVPIQVEEHLARIAKAQAYMQSHKIDAIYLNAGTNLTYFTGMPVSAWSGLFYPQRGRCNTSRLILKLAV